MDTLTTSLQNNTQEPSVVFKDGRWIVYYIGIGLFRPNKAVYDSGQSFTAFNLLRQPFNTDLVSLGAPEVCSTSMMVNITEVLFQDNKYHLFYTTASMGEFHRNEHIAYANSADGLVWEDGGIVVATDSTHAHENWGIMAPAVARWDDSLFMFYTGWGAEGHPCFPVPAGGRFGMHLSGDRCVYGSVGRAVAPVSLTNAIRIPKPERHPISRYCQTPFPGSFN